MTAPVDSKTSTTPEQFRRHFKAFADQDCYPDYAVEFWMNVGVLMVNASRWGELTAFGIEMFVAHNLAIEQMNAQGAAGGNAPGRAYGPMTSKSVDKVSAAYDIASVSLKDAGAWNLTTYGTRFYQLRQMMGAGGIQVGTPGYGPDPGFGFGGFGQAWPGYVQNPWGTN